VETPVSKLLISGELTDNMLLKIDKGNGNQALDFFCSKAE